MLCLHHTLFLPSVSRGLVLSTSYTSDLSSCSLIMVNLNQKHGRCCSHLISSQHSVKYNRQTDCASHVTASGVFHHLAVYMWPVSGFSDYGAAGTLVKVSRHRVARRLILAHAALCNINNVQSGCVSVRRTIVDNRKVVITYFTVVCLCEVMRQSLNIWEQNCVLVRYKSRINCGGCLRPFGP